MNTVDNNTTPTFSLWGMVKQIVTINGFFGPGFCKDFSEGWKEGCKKAASAPHVVDEDENNEINPFESDYSDDAWGNHNTPPYWRPHDPGSDYNPHDADMVANPYIHPDSNLW